MADQKINELPTKTAPSTGDKMLMIGAAEEYQIDYDKLASAILDKLATKQYSELDTTAKTVLGALDELNSKTNIMVNSIQEIMDTIRTIRSLRTYPIFLSADCVNEILGSSTVQTGRGIITVHSSTLCDIFFLIGSSSITQYSARINNGAVQGNISKLEMNLN